jgi:hypothetical protein
MRSAAHAAKIQVAVLVEGALEGSYGESLGP